ncbi:MAG TPA: OmpA family protein [Candidatus Binatia bacterium]|nr:OmpA family protein [Candidatus Binatia bacterium]
MKRARVWASVLVCIATMSAARAFAAADEYDDSQSNPLRVAAYLAYPVGWLAEWLIFRPFHFMVSATPAQESFFGHRPHPPILAEPQPIQDYGMPKRVPPKPAAPQAAAPTVTIAPERVTVAEVPVEKIVVKEIPKVVETEKIVFPAVAFRFDSAELTDLGKGQVYLAAQRLKEKNDITVVIEGHTDAVGSDEYNQKLGQRRARTVMRELSALGIEPERMSAVSFGESRPLIAQETNWAYAVNRRVEFQVKGSR